MKIRIYIASMHDYDFPQDKIYVPIHVGKFFSQENFSDITDNTGLNISYKNKKYCELTALYWMWKNDKESDYMGLCHYRRYFSARRFGFKRTRVLSGEKIEEIILAHPDAVIVPHHRNYLNDTLYSHYANTHDAQHLKIARRVIDEKFPEDVDVFDKTMMQNKAFMFNMFIMKREQVNRYASWVFEILSGMENLIDTTNMTEFEARLFGRVAELLWNVWLNKEHCEVFEVKYVNLTGTKWMGKIFAYLGAKYFGKKLTRSY